MSRNMKVLDKNYISKLRAVQIKNKRKRTTYPSAEQRGHLIQAYL